MTSWGKKRAEGPAGGPIAAEPLFLGGTPFSFGLTAIILSGTPEIIAQKMVAGRHEPRLMMEIAFYATMLCTLALGVIFYRTGKMGYWFSLAVLLTFLISAAAFISFISVYFYELPTHHCPFCILQKEYGYIGYFLYLTLLVGGLSGMGAGVLMPSRRIPSLKATLPGWQKNLTLVSILSYLLFGRISRSKSPSPILKCNGSNLIADP